MKNGVENGNYAKKSIFGLHRDFKGVIVPARRGAARLQNSPHVEVFEVIEGLS